MPAVIQQITLVETDGAASGADRDEQLMGQALALARRGIGRVSPNPPVGCVLVRDDQVVGAGYHQEFGGPHAEAMALSMAGAAARGATAYVTLEPCAGDGKKTPPCAPALIDAGIVRVVVAVRDPNPRVNGRGLSLLESAGIDVIEGVMGQVGARLVRGFASWVLTGRPHVILKVARTQDNFVAAALSGNGWFTSPESKTRVHRLRSEVDGVMVGRRTAELDNPQLTVRDYPGANPKRIVLDTHLRLRPELRLFSDGAAPTLVMTSVGTTSETPWGEQIRVAAAPEGVNLEQVLAELGARGMTSVMVEGGPTVHRAFLQADLADEVVIFTSARSAEQSVHVIPELRNVLSVPAGWTVLSEEQLGGDRLEVAQRDALPIADHVNRTERRSSN